MTVYEKICLIIKENLYLEEDFGFNSDITFTELGTDSLDMVEIIMAIEDAFDIQIEDEELSQVRNLGELTELVTKLTDR